MACGALERQGEWGSELYLIAKGRIEVLKIDAKKDESSNPSPAIHSHPTSMAKQDTCFSPGRFSRRRRTNGENKEKTRVTVLESGSFFGEVSMIYEVPRISTCRAITQCDLFSLSRDDFYSVMMMHPEQLEKISYVANQRALMTQGHPIASLATSEQEQPEMKDAAFTIEPHKRTSPEEAAGTPICKEAICVDLESDKRNDAATFAAPSSVLKPGKNMQYTHETRAMPAAGPRTRSKTVAALGGGSLIDTVKQQAQQRKRNCELSIANSQQREIALIDVLESSELSEEVKDIIIQHTCNVLRSCASGTYHDGPCGTINAHMPETEEAATTSAVQMTQQSDTSIAATTSAGQMTQQSDTSIEDTQQNTMDQLESHSLTTSQVDMSL